jgi:hypothetical protein
VAQRSYTRSEGAGVRFALEKIGNDEVRLFRKVIARVIGRLAELS